MTAAITSAGAFNGSISRASLLILALKLERISSIKAAVDAWLGFNRLRFSRNAADDARISECDWECFINLRRVLAANLGGGLAGPSISSAGDEVRLNAPES